MRPIPTVANPCRLSECYGHTKADIWGYRVLKITQPYVIVLSLSSIWHTVAAIFGRRVRQLCSALPPV